MLCDASPQPQTKIQLGYANMINLLQDTSKGRTELNGGFVFDSTECYEIA